MILLVFFTSNIGVYTQEKTFLQSCGYDIMVTLEQLMLQYHGYVTRLKMTLRNLNTY